MTAFTAVAGAATRASSADLRTAGKGVNWVSVILADHVTVTLPISADEFEEIVTDAQRRGRIADFSGGHVADRIDDLAARRKHPAVEAPATPALDRARRLRDAYLERPPSPPTRHWNFEPGPFNPDDPAIEGLSPRLSRWFAEQSIRPVPRHDGADVDLIAKDWLMASGAASAFVDYLLDRAVQSHSGAPPSIPGLLGSRMSAEEEQRLRTSLKKRYFGNNRTP